MESNDKTTQLKARVFPASFAQPPLIEWNATKTDYPQHLCVHELFEEQVVKAPDAVAIVFKKEQLSYAELNCRANQLAHHLRSLGVGPEVMVGICMERSLEMVVGLLGILKAGGAYVPMDPAYPQQRLAYMLEDSQASVLLTQMRLKNGLPKNQAQVICLDEGWEKITLCNESRETPQSGVTSGNLAYVIYTSGSSGTPKGVEITHRGLMNLVTWHQRVYEVTPSDRASQVAAIGFDASVWELWPYLTAGASVHIVSEQIRFDVEKLIPWLNNNAITFSFLPTPVAEILLAEKSAKTLTLKALLVGGDTLHRNADDGMSFRLINHYGPTESTVVATCAEVCRGATGVPPIGKPIANTQAYVLDSDLQPVPVGVSGELHIGGDSLARGYLRRPNLTAEKFIPNPFSKKPGERMYKTGDLVRCLPDGNIEFLGRLDQQVKVRGFRIELGEIEAVLNQHPNVEASVAVAREEETGDKRLVAYVIPNRAYPVSADERQSSVEIQTEQVKQWQLIYDETYKRACPDLEPTFQVTGWNSSYTGQPLPQEDMREWLDHTVERILPLQPKRILEIGCGTGLLLFRLAPHCFEYVGTDISQVALTYLRQQIEAMGLSNVTLSQKEANDFDSVETNRFDVVVINSVAQYFPSIDYLVVVLERAVRAVRPGGFIFIGDVRSLPLLEAFHASVQLFAADASLSIEQFKHRVRQELGKEEELVIDPAFFTALQAHLPQITQVQVLPKRGRHQNEMTKFRYDVILHTNPTAVGRDEVPCLQWQDQELTLASLRQLLQETRPDILGFARVPNARVVADTQLLKFIANEAGPQTVGELREAIQPWQAAGIDPEEFWRLGQELSYAVQVSWAEGSSDGAYDVVFRRQGAFPEEALQWPVPGVARRQAALRPWREYANHPLAKIQFHDLVPKLRRFLEERLPEYMVPSAFVQLDELPLTTNGKLDRQALPAPDQSRPGLASEFVAPRTPIEERLMGIWAQLLGFEEVGVHDNFFELGGHSLLGIQIISRIRDAFQIELSLHDLFEYPTIAGLSQQIISKGIAEPCDQAIAKVTKSGPLPLSFGQQRLWFLNQLIPDTPVHNIPAAIEITSQIDIAVLEQSLNAIIRRHETLRTTFAIADGNPVQVVAPNLTIMLPVTDLRDLPETERQAEAKRITNDEARRPFNLATGPLLRARLVRLAENEHILLLTMHHIVSDGWSMGILFRELGALYEAFSDGKPSPLSELPIQYSDFVIWQRQWLQQGVMEEQLSYWTQQLAGAPAYLELPTDHPRPSVQTFRGAHHSLTLSKSLSSGLKSLSQHEGNTLFITLLAAFQLLLYRHSGQDDILIGTPIVNRPRTETEGLIGFFLNNLVLRTKLSDKFTFQELVSCVCEVALEAYAHQDVPFEKLVEKLNPERDLSRPPLFQIFFNMLNFSEANIKLPGLTDKVFSAAEVWSQPDEAWSQFDLTLYAREQEEEIQFILVYNSDIFDPSRMIGLLEQYRHLLEQIIVAPEKQIKNYSLVSPESRPLLPDPGESLPEPEYQVITKTFAEWAERTPEKSVICQGERSWSYGELAGCANRLARSLIAAGVTPGDVVAVTGPRSFGLITSLMAVLSSGGVLLTIDPSLPVNRRQLMLQEAGAKFLLDVGTWQAEDDWMSKHPSLPIMRVERNDGSVVAPTGISDPKEISLPQLNPDDPAYLFFTSGTTGVPKAVLGCHKGLSHFLTWQRETFEVGPEDCCAQLTAISFDVVLRDIFLSLTSGASLHLPDDTDDPSNPEILRWMERENITLFHTVPALAQTWLASVPADASLKTLRWIFFAGEPLTDTLVQQWRKNFPESGSIVNLYGPTETTLAKCFFVVPVNAPMGVQPVGYPLPETQALILGEGDQLCGIGEVGEIVLRTPFRSLGYINSSDENQKRFFINPFGNEKGDLLYRTGDRGRFRLDGSLEILGRIDDQVKIRGVRVEPGEVTAVLSSHPAIESCIVIASKDERAQSQLAAYVVSNSHNKPSASDLRSYLHTQLPAAMVPSSFIFLEKLPLTANGKVDRQALPVPDLSRCELEREFVAPRTTVEELLASIWGAVLMRERLGVYDDFFELGGHSLLATQVISRVRDVFHVDLPVRWLFESPKLAQLASRIEAAQRIEQGIQAPPLLPVSRDKELPLSFAQQRLWFLHQLEPGSSAYNLSQMIRLQGKVDINALRQSLDEIVRRHESLRTTFPVVDGNPVQAIAEKASIELPVIDLSHLPENEGEVEARRLAAQESERPFDLAKGPLLRVTLFSVGADAHLLLMTMHHIVSDGWSRGVFTRELTLLYDAYCAGNPSPLPELPIQYADFTCWQRDWMQGDVLEKQLSYWKQQLTGAEVLQLPTDRPYAAAQSFRSAIESFHIPPSLSEALIALSRREGVTLFMVLLAAFKVLLYRYSGQKDIVVGSAIANRNRAEIEGLIGFFVNSLALRTDLSGDPTFLALLGRVREVTLGAYAHQDLPFEKLVSELQLERDLNRNPLFNVMFVVQNSPAYELKLRDLTLNLLESESAMAKFDLEFHLYETSEGIKGLLINKTDLYDSATIKRMLGHYGKLLEGIAADPQQRVSNVTMLTAAERRQMLKEWNNTGREFPQPLLAHEMFEQQAERTPQAVAISCQGQQITYGELDRKANQLARYLAKKGAGPDHLIGICVERGLKMVVGLLGILKAGAAYVPLDPAYPQQRLSFMLEDAAVSLLLTQEHLLERLPNQKAETVCLDRDWGAIAEQRERKLESRIEPENLAYVIYTSGSTGKPKGVQIQHSALSNFLSSMRQQPGLGQDDVLLAVTTLSFDIAGLEIYLPLSVGARLSLVNREVASDAAELMRWIDEEAATVMQATPATWRMLMEAGWRGKLNLKMVCGGETLPRELSEELANRGAGLWNMYGPTETTIWSTAYKVERRSGPVPIGRPIANTHVYIVDRNLQPMPVGVAGELYIGGDGLARGYLKQPELTGEKFIPNPFSQEGGGRLYKTGDLARYLPDGTIEVLGRIDHQVKVRGYRIELGEVEAVLSQHEAVRENVVIADGGESGGKRLVAYIVADGEEGISVAELRSYLKEKLPEYMVPSAFVLMDKLPLTYNGKINRQALPAPTQIYSELVSEFVAPRTPVEEAVARVWSEVLSIEPIGVHDNFFELGGHSLLATQVLSRLQETFQVELLLRCLFEAPTLADLSRVIEKAKTDGVALRAPSITRISRESYRVNKSLKGV